MRAPIACGLPFLLCCAVACGGENPSGTSDGGSDPCPACGVGEVCDPAAGRCVAALAEGTPCEDAADGGVVEGRCGPGLVCGMVSGGIKRCSIDCTARSEEQACGAGRKCFARPGSTSEGFCGQLGSEGESCDIDRLSFCAGGLSCITPEAGVTAGRCFESCVPGLDQCAEGRSCADPFPEAPTVGFCVVPPGGYPNRCDHATLTFCGEGELCVRPTDESWGYCHQRCATGSECPGASCVSPLPGVSFCAAAAARCPAGANPADCESCRGELDVYCGAADLCVQAGSWAVCRQRCDADPAVCPEGTTCSTLQGSSDKACL